MFYNGNEYDLFALPHRQVANELYAVLLTFKNKWIMERDFRVQLLMNDTYQVLNADDDSVAYQGNLANCEAYIRLHESGYF